MPDPTPKPPPPDPRRQVTLDEFLGNATLRAFLRRAWAGGRLPQTLLVSGPPGVGKTTLAWALAREIVADGGDAATHPRALKVARGTHPDVLALAPKGGSVQIRVDQIREMENWSATSALESPRKIAIVEPADRMNDSSANGLLKILEEPPPHLLFVLITAEPGRLLDTIRSRSTPLRLEPVPLDDLTPWLMRKAGLEEERARLLATLSEGRPGFALALAQGPVLEARGRVLEALGLLVQHGFAAVFRAAHLLLDLELDLEATLMLAVTLLRDALALRLRGAGVLNQDLAGPLAALAAGRSDEGLLEAARRLAEAAAEAPFFYQPQAKTHFMECVVTDVGRMLRK